MIYLNFGKDEEYNRILRELKQAGVLPTGIKSADKSKLKNLKNSKIREIKQKVNHKTQCIKELDKEKNEASIKSSLMPNNLGAMQLSELNKIYHQV